MTAAVPVAQIVAAFPDRCPRCGNRAQWAVGPDAVACDRCLPRTLRAVIRESDGFCPPIPELLAVTT